MASRPDNPSAFIATMLSPMATKPTHGQRTRTITRLLRHRGTGLYFCNGQWTQDPLLATDFVDCLEAVQACVRYGLTQVDLCMHLGTGSHDFFSTPLR